MRIGIDARSIVRRRGIGNVVFHLLQELSKLDDDCAYLIYVDRHAACQLVPEDPRFAVRVLTPAFYPVWEQLMLPQQAKADHVNLLHSPANSGPRFLSSSIARVLTIHDVMYLMSKDVVPLSPSPYQRLGRAYLSVAVPAAAKRADAIITVSESSRKDLIEHLDAVPEGIVVIPSAANAACRRIDDALFLKSVREKHGLSRPFVLALGAIDPRKNTERIIQAYKLLAMQLASPPQLVIVGLRPSERRYFLPLITGPAQSGNIVFLDFVSDADLVALYNEALMLLYPSLYEGFGLPVLEAMACGTPVITTRRGSLPEVAGDAALTVDPHEPNAMATAMLRLLTDPVLRARMTAAGVLQAAKFSWKRMAVETVNVYRRVLCR